MIQYILMSQAETENYCRKMRYKRYKKYGAYIDYLPLHNLFHNLFILLLKASRLIEHQNLVIVSDKSRKTDKPIIFTPVHIGGDDIPMLFEAIKLPCWLLMGDPREMYRDIEGMILEMNGLICFDTAFKLDRKIAKERMIALLRKGGNLLIFPEGAWNVTPDKPVMHLFSGAVEAAIVSEAEIVPIAIVKNGRTYYVNIGRNIAFSAKDLSQKYELTEKLRSVMAKMQWELIEKTSPAKRADLNGYLQEFYREIEGHNKVSYHIADAVATRFKPKGQIEIAEAFEHLKRILPNKNNAFLFDKNNHH